MPPVAITIDVEFPDQPASDPLAALEGVLEALARHQVRATFFVVGTWASTYPDRVAAIKEAGHHIGNHSYSHCPLPRLTPAGIVEDLTGCHDVLAGLGIESRPWFRAPQGELGQAQVDAVAAIKLAGYRHIHWHAHGEDWRPTATAEAVASTILAGVQDRWPRPAIVLLHSWPDCAPGALDLLLSRLKAEDASFLTVDELSWRHAVAGRVREATTQRGGG